MLAEMIGEAKIIRGKGHLMMIKDKDCSISALKQNQILMMMERMRAVEDLRNHYLTT
jgi:hypothetical protein